MNRRNIAALGIVAATVVSGTWLWPNNPTPAVPPVKLGRAVKLAPCPPNDPRLCVARPARSPGGP